MTDTTITFSDFAIDATMVFHSKDPLGLQMNTWWSYILWDIREPIKSYYTSEATEDNQSSYYDAIPNCLKTGFRMLSNCNYFVNTTRKDDSKVLKYNAPTYLSGK